MKIFLTAILLTTVLYSFGQISKQNCVCSESQIKADTKPDTIFYLQNGTSISFCGYKVENSNPPIYTKFVLAFCLPDTILDIDIWPASEFCYIRILGDTLLVDGIETKKSEKFYLKDSKIIRKTIAKPSYCQLTNPDTSVFGIILLDKKSSIKQVGIMTTPHESGNDLPHLNFCTQDKKQTLTVFFHPGSVANEFAEFQVKIYSATDSAKTLMTNSFMTGKEVKPGMSKENIIAIFGKCYKATATNNNLELIKYHIDDLSNSKFLERFNYSSYYAEYEFKAGKLVRFRFGFEYP